MSSQSPDYIKIECELKYPNNIADQYLCYQEKTNELIDSLFYTLIRDNYESYINEKHVSELVAQITDLIQKNIKIESDLIQNRNKIVGSTLKIEGLFKGREWRRLSERKDQRYKAKHIELIRLYFESDSNDLRDIRIEVYDTYFGQDINNARYDFNLEDSSNELPIILKMKGLSKHTYKISVQSNGEEIAYALFSMK